MIKNTLYIIFLFSSLAQISCSSNNNIQPIESNKSGYQQNTSNIAYTNVFTDTITDIPYDIPSQRFDETAQALCHATGCFIETDLDKTGSIKVNSIKGRMSLLQALKTAISGTPLVITEQTPNKIKIELQ